MVLEFTVNYFSVIVAAFASFIIGFLWYGPIFGKQWISLSNMSEKDIKKAKEKGMAKQMVVSFIAALIMAYVLSLFINFGGNVNALVGVTVGFWIWLGFLATTMIDSVLWDNKPFALYLINVSHRLVGLIIMGAILGAWA
jgi:fatty acid desaturase